MENKQKPIRSLTEEIIIGKNKYIVTTHFKENGSETAADKLLQYVSERMSDRLRTPKKAVI